MAKGNMLLGYSRGSVGDVTFSRVKGNQVARARNRQPANPKTSKQVYQRAKFLNAVNFYKRAVQNLFKFAYEDKTAQESDFNAFMRHNVSRSIPVGKDASTDTSYPAISNWLTSVGSLNGPQAVIGYTLASDALQCEAGRLYAGGQYNVSPTTEGVVPLADQIVAEAFFSVPDNITTFGSLCQGLKQQYPDLQEGDIVTVSLINQILQGIGEPQSLLPNAGGIQEGAQTAPAWYFAQFIIDSTSTTPIANAYGNEIYLSAGLSAFVMDDVIFAIAVDKTWQQVYSETIGGTFQPDVFTNMSSCTAAVMTFSRETPNGLRVSTQELSTSEGYQQLIELSRTQAFAERVLASWGATDTAILEGSFIKA